MARKDAAPDALATTRVEALTDGVFAIVLTLLILEFKVPNAESGEQLFQALLAMKPVLFSYLITFAMLGVYWVGHHYQFHYIRSADRVLLWINLVFLLLVSFLLFSTALLGQFPEVPLPSILYGFNLICIGLTAYGHWAYATKHHRLTSHDVSNRLVCVIKGRILVAPTVALIAILLSLLHHTFWSLVLYLLLPPFYIWPARFDQLWSQPAVAHSH